MAAIVSMVIGMALQFKYVIETNLNKSKLALYKLLLSL